METALYLTTVLCAGIFGWLVMYILSRDNGTRKEFEELEANLAVNKIESEAVEKHLLEKINSLAKELGYEWTSEAVKERGFFMGEWFDMEKAVLKWGWKKIEDDDFTEEWERQAKIKKK